MDPLLAAMIGKLPDPGKPFPGEQRANWLKMMAMAFDVAYGHAEDMPAFLPSREGRATTDPAPATASEPPKPLRMPHAGHTFYIDAGGNALRGEGEPVFATDVPPDELIFDYRPVAGDFRDLESITWADGSHGTAGLPGGISFCGPG